MLTTQQKTAVKTDITNNSDLSANPNTEPGNFAIAALYNTNASPNFWVWKTTVTEAEIVGQPSIDATLFSWSVFINRSQGERDGWMRLFRSGIVNPALSNVQAAIADIFSGAGGAAQRTHILTTFRRKATRLEKLFATGTGSTAVPATLTYEGAVSLQDINEARA